MTGDLVPLRMAGYEGSATSLAAHNLALMLGLLFDRPLSLTVSTETRPGLLTMQRHDGPIESRDLQVDIRLARSWRHSGETWSSHFPVDVLGWLDFFLERREEMSGPRDEHGRFEQSASLIERAALNHVPVLDELVSALRDFLIHAAAARGVSSTRLSPWPAGAKYAVALSHDIDHARDVDWIGASVKLGGAGVACLRGQRPLARRRVIDALGLFSRRRKSPYWLMGDMRQVELEHGIDTTFFVLPNEAARVREGANRVRRYDVRHRRIRRLLDHLNESGAELGLHTTYVAADSPTGVAEDLSRLRAVTPLGAPIRGVRNHYLRYFVGQSLTSLMHAGLEWDSSLGWARGWGFRAGTTMPFRIGSAGSSGVWQFSLQLMDVAVPLREFGPALEDLLHITAQHGGLATVLVHPDPYDNATAEQHLDFYRLVVSTIMSRPDCWVATGSAIADAMSRYEAQVTSTGHTAARKMV